MVLKGGIPWNKDKKYKRESDTLKKEILILLCLLAILTVANASNAICDENNECREIPLAQNEIQQNPTVQLLKTDITSFLKVGHIAGFVLLLLAWAGFRTSPWVSMLMLIMAIIIILLTVV